MITLRSHLNSFIDTLRSPICAIQWLIMILTFKMGVTKTNIGLLYRLLKFINVHIFWCRIVLSHIPLRAEALCSRSRSSATTANNYKKITCIDF